MLSRESFFARWSSLHNDVEVSGIVRWWLTISYRCARVRVSANAITAASVLVALATLAIPHSAWAILLVVLTLFLDGIDGSVAMVHQKESHIGGLYDSVSDRIVEAIWAYLFYSLGAPAWMAIALWSLGAVQEYARTKVISLGVRDIGVVTPSERPVRASALFVAMVFWHLGLSATTLVASVALVLQLISVLLVVRFANRSLRQPSQR